MRFAFPSQSCGVVEVVAQPQHQVLLGDLVGGQKIRVSDSGENRGCDQQQNDFFL